MKLERAPFKELNDRGLAIGSSNICADTMSFDYRDEHFEFPAMEVFRLATHNGYFYTAPIEKLRALAKKNKNGKAKKQEENAAP